MSLPEIKKRDEFDSLVILRGCVHLIEDILHSIKQNPVFQDYEFAKMNLDFRKLIERRIKNVLKNEPKEVTEIYNTFANNLVKAFNDAAQLEFMDSHEKAESREGEWFSVQIDGKKAYALYSNERYWVARNPVGYKESEIEINGQMVAG